MNVEARSTAPSEALAGCEVAHMAHREDSAERSAGDDHRPTRGEEHPR